MWYPYHMKYFMRYLYHIFTARKFREDNVFTDVCLSTWGEDHTPPPRIVPPGTIPLPLRDGNPPGTITPQLLTPSGSHPADGWQAGGTHPTGMHYYLHCMNE